MSNERPIGLFDSGVGGLTVLKAVAALSPSENLLYLGDTARVPYGSKSQATIVRYTLMVAAQLAARDVKMLVIACNTATSAALPVLREKVAPIPVIGVIEPGAEAAVRASKSGRIAVIATEATIESGAYQRAISRLNPEARVLARPCGLFVPLAEEGWLEGDAPEVIARRYLEDIFSGPAEERPDTLLLGCTHFPLLAGPLRKVIGPGALLVDSASATAKVVRGELARLGLEREAGKTARRLFLTTDNPARFARAGGLFLGAPIPDDLIELVDL